MKNACCACRSNWQSITIIDELGFVPLSKTGAELLFEVFSQRYERGSILVTSNLPFDEWTEIFGSVAVTVAVAVNDQGRREVLGMAIGASEAETFWTEFLRSLARRGLRGVKLVISDDHKGLKAAATRILGATWQRCRVHFARNLLAHAGRQGRRVVSAFVATAFAQEDADSAKVQWRQVADQLRPKVPKLAALMDEAEHDVLAYMSFPKEHRQKLHSRPTRSNGSMPRSSAAPTSSASFPTKTPSHGSSAPSFSSRTTSGPSQGDT